MSFTSLVWLYLKKKEKKKSFPDVSCMMEVMKRGKVISGLGGSGPLAGR